MPGSGWRAVLLLLAVWGLLPACAPQRVYEGPVRARCEVARLVVLDDGVYFARPGSVRFTGRIVDVDGRRVCSTRGVVEVLPGRHTVSVMWKRLEIPAVGLAWEEHRTGAWAETHSGIDEFVVDTRAGGRYELIWPFADEDSGPRGFEEVTP